MSRYDLTNIDSINGDNMGGICTFDFVAKEGIDDFADADALTGEALYAITLVPGFAWLTATCLRDSMEFTEDQQTAEAGSYFAQKLSGVINKDDIDMQALNDALRYKECIVIYTDRNGKKKLIGKPSKAMNFTSRLATGLEVKDKTAFCFEFTNESSERAMHYPF
jgi:hypothetical protein